MPLYSFKCSKCNKEQEHIMSYSKSEEKDNSCQEKDCTGLLVKQTCAPGGFAFTGKGCWGSTEKHGR